MDELTRLWLAARDGQHGALAQAIRASEADVYRLVAHLVGPADADDAAQDAFVRAWRALPQFRADSSARTWLLAIARRACADAIRGNMRRRRVRTQYAHERHALTSHSDTASSHALDALIAGLDPDQRAAFVLTQIVGCSYAEAATICDVPVGTIRSRVARARERLVAQLDEADTG
jgi:RNA polymerase sigma-70 factor (ECF subfamily)